MVWEVGGRFSFGDLAGRTPYAQIGVQLQTERSSRSAESLSGLIERVTFHNEENRFAVMEVKAKGHRDLVTVVGSLATVSAGEWVTAEARWVQDLDFLTPVSR